MRIIQKYPLRLSKSQIVSLRRYYRPVHMGLDGQGTPCLWAEVDTDMPVVDKRVYMVSTGDQLPDGSVETGAPVHAGTFLDGAGMWHVYIT